MAGERTQAPTQKRREDARKRGQVPRSREVDSALVILASYAVLSVGGGAMWEGMRSLLIESFEQLDRQPLTIELTANMGLGLMGRAVLILAPLMISVLALSLVGGMAQTGGSMFAMEAATPQYKRLNPMEGAKRLVASKQAYMNLLKTLLKFLVFGLAALLTFRAHWTEMIALGVAFSLAESVALLTTIAIYVPATPIALWLLGSGLLDAPAQAIPGGWADIPAAAVRPAVVLLKGVLPSAALFALGVGSLLSAFALFDRLLPNLDPPSARFERLSKRFSSPRAMFLFGALVTSITMSVSLSVTILVPLTLKNILQRRDVVPYVMGANITTFLDTLFASLLLESPHGAPVVLAEMLSVAAVSAVVLLTAWEPFCAGVLGLAHRVIGRRTSLVAFMVVLFVVPLGLIL